MINPQFKAATLITHVGHSVKLTRSDGTSPHGEQFADRDSTLADLLSGGWKIESSNIASGGGLVIVDTLVHFTPGSSAGLGIDY